MTDDDILTQTTCPLEMLLPDSNPKTKFGLAKTPLRLIPTTAMIAEADAFADGATKYGPFNWRQSPVSAGTYYEAAMRHLFAWYEGEERDPESGALHLAHARACLGILIDADAHGKLLDNRPPRGDLPVP